MLIIRPIEDECELEMVYTLTHQAYISQGYCWPCLGRRLAHYPHLDRIPETTVLVAVDDGAIIATNSWTWDGVHGLHVDADFKVAVDAIRREGRRLAASWRIITDPGYRAHRQVIMGLIRRTVVDMVRAGVETALFSFNPQHERVYRRLLNMSTVATVSSIDTLRAPAVLMRLDKESVPQRFLTGETHGL